MSVQFKNFVTIPLFNIFVQFVLVTMMGMVGTIFRGVAANAHHAPALVCMVTVVTFRPVASIATKMESRRTNNTSNSSSTSSTRQQKTAFYGTALLPKDVAYHQPTKDALTEIRDLKRNDVKDCEDDNNSSGPAQVLKSCGNKDSGTLTLIGYKGGPMDAQINQDRSFCVSPFYLKEDEDGEPDRKLLGVFDGHAPLGENVSQFSMEELPKLLANKLAEVFDNRNPQDVKQDETEIIKKILIETFIELDKKAPAHVSGGCTASVIFQQGPKVYVANAGDSASFIVMYRAKSKKTTLVYISREDKPNLPDERKRVESMGGEVYIPFHGTSRVLYMDFASGQQSGLAMSRSIGDWAAGKLGVIPDPIVGVIDIDDLVRDQLDNEEAVILDEYSGAEPAFSSSANNEADDVHIFAVSATDGLMDYAPAEAIAKVLAISLYDEDGPHLLTACEQLIYYAAQGWYQTRGGTYRDDIAIAVSKLRSPPTDNKADR